MKFVNIRGLECMKLVEDAIDVGYDYTGIVRFDVFDAAIGGEER